MNPFMQAGMSMMSMMPGMSPYGGMPQFQMNPLATNANINSMLRPQPSAGEPKKVFVGKIPPNLSDTFMLKLLESCGSVASWKRATDTNGKPKGFGYCEYQSVESMLKCLRLLNTLKIEEGYELSVSFI
jgi:RNA recognition motif-containing protein